MGESRLSLENKNRLSWWFPKIPSDVLVPLTIIVPHDGESLVNLIDGKTPSGFEDLCLSLIDAGDRLGWPMFLRTDFLSGKHSWKDTCCVSDAADVSMHVRQLVEESCMADMWGFPTDRWVARRMIPTVPSFAAFRGEMPIVKERRYFVQDAQVMCHHPYWPMKALLLGDLGCEVPNWSELLDEMNVEDVAEVNLLSELSSKVGAAIGGAWSIDWLWSEQNHQWYLIDMAEADKSFHWPGCPIINQK